MNTRYLKEVLSQLESEFGFKPDSEIPDGTYSMRIGGVVDKVEIKDNTISVKNLRPQRWKK